jgi:hypothetical protein
MNILLFSASDGFIDDLFMSATFASWRRELCPSQEQHWLELQKQVHHDSAKRKPYLENGFKKTRYEQQS